MISIIISSINKSLLNQLSENIKQTIGVDYELLAFDNTIKKWGIAKVYNYCASKAKYECLVFCHEDILFHTKNWGQKIINLLGSNNIKLVGVSGAVYKSAYPTSWSAVPQNYYRINAIQQYKNKPPKYHKINPRNTFYSDVVVIDGLFMAIKKNIFNKFSFNEKELKGFHLYDIDLSVHIAQHYKVVVSNEIVVEHFSLGILDKTWFKTSILWHSKNKQLLPIFTTNISENELKRLEKQAIKSVITTCYALNTQYLLMLKLTFKLLILALFEQDTYKYFRLLIIQTLGLKKIKKLWK